jgi:hypothetical protein
MNKKTTTLTQLLTQRQYNQILFVYLKHGRTRF